jgi:hypothetical protein
VRSVTGNRIWVYWYRYFLKPFLCRVVDPDWLSSGSGNSILS